MSEAMTVNFDCRTGDVIFFKDDEGWSRNARVVDTWPNKVRVQFSDEDVRVFSYKTLRERGAIYVAQVVIVATPSTCPVSGC